MQSVHNVCKQIMDKNDLSIHAESNVPIEGDFCSGVILDILCRMKFVLSGYLFCPAKFPRTALQWDYVKFELKHTT